MDTWPLRLRHVSIDGNMIELVQSLPVVDREYSRKDKVKAGASQVEQSRIVM